MTEDIQSNWEAWQKHLDRLGWQDSLYGRLWEADTRSGTYQVHRDSYDGKYILAWYSNDEEEEDVESYEFFNELLLDINYRR